MKTNIEVNGTGMTIAMEGRLDTLTVTDLQKELEQYKIGELTEVVLDLSKLEYISSAGLRLLLHVYRNMKNGGEMRVINANDITRKVFEVTGFDSIITIE